MGCWAVNKGEVVESSLDFTCAGLSKNSISSFFELLPSDTSPCYTSQCCAFFSAFFSAFRLHGRHLHIKHGFKTLKEREHNLSLCTFTKCSCPARCASHAGFQSSSRRYTILEQVLEGDQDNHICCPPAPSTGGYSPLLSVLTAPAPPPWSGRSRPQRVAACNRRTSTYRVTDGDAAHWPCPMSAASGYHQPVSCRPYLKIHVLLNPTKRTDPRLRLLSTACGFAPRPCNRSTYRES